MRLVSKLTLLFMFGLSVVLSADGYLTVQRELALFDRDMQTDARVFGQFLAHTIRDTWQTQGRAQALGILRDANADTAGLHVTWVVLEPEPDTDTPLADPGVRERLARGDVVSIMTDDSIDGHLYTYIPTRLGDHAGALALTQPLRTKHEYTRATKRRVMLLVAVTLVVCTLLALLLGVWLVGRPVRALIRRTRQIGAGQLEGHVALRQRDELGMLARAIDTMSEQLILARERVAGETQKRLQAVEQLRHADRLATVGTLAAGVAHELGTPLNVIMERAALVQHEQVSGERITDNARIIREQAERIASIVRQLLDFSRPNPVARSHCDLGGLARDVVELLQSFARKRDVELAYGDTGDNRFLARVAVEHIRQALINLLMNAIQASPGNTAVSITVSRERATPDPGGSWQGTAPGTDQDGTADHICIRVTDHGLGIDAEYLPHIFEPFFTTKEIGDGTGLGLSVTYGIVKDHGGWIGVDTEPDQGTCFAVYLPAASDVT